MRVVHLVPAYTTYRRSRFFTTIHTYDTVYISYVICMYASYAYIPCNVSYVHMYITYIHMIYGIGMHMFSGIRVEAIKNVNVLPL